MRTGRSEALDILNGWLSAQSDLRCFIEFPTFSVTLRGKVFAIQDSKVTILSDDNGSELALKLTAATEFGYGEPRMSPEDAALYESVLTVYPASLPGTGTIDLIAIAKFKESA
jgi:hypothetical protein